MEVVMSYDSLLGLVKKRRSIRRFKSDPVPRELIEKIVEAARWAPSGFNMQPWEYVIVQKEELRRRIVEITSDFWRQSAEMETARPSNKGRSWKLTGMNNEKGDYTEAPVYIIVCGDPRTVAGLPMGVQCDLYRRNTIYTSGLASTFLLMHLAAASLGLASQWYSAVQSPYPACMIKDLLKIPMEFDVFDMMVLGYPAIVPPKKFLRDTATMVHWDGCTEQDLRSDAEVRDFVLKTRNWTIGTHSRKARD
jgi:nitroreductase